MAGDAVPRYVVLTEVLVGFFAALVPALILYTVVISALGTLLDGGPALIARPLAGLGLLDPGSATTVLLILVTAGLGSYWRYRWVRAAGSA